MDPDRMIEDLLYAHDQLAEAIENQHDVHNRLDKFKHAHQVFTDTLTQLQTLTTWLPYPENTPTLGETYNVLQHYPDGWNYQIATYTGPDLRRAWFSQILACDLRYVTHFAPQLPLPEEE